MNIVRSSEINHIKPPSKNGSEYPYSSSAEVFHTNQLFLYSEKVEAGKKASAPHYHRSIDEIAVITSGELYAIEGESEALLTVGDSICFKANSEKKHYLENRSEANATFLLFRRSTNQSDVIY